VIVDVPGQAEHSSAKAYISVVSARTVILGLDPWIQTQALPIDIQITR